MNNRDYKIFRQGNYYHIYNRGNNKEPIFLDSQDYNVFLNRLRLALGFPEIFNSTDGQGGSLTTTTQRKRNRVRIIPFPPNTFNIICFCLMPNHFHFMIRQNTHINIDRLVAKLCTSYSMYFNRKYKHIGNVFQDHFKAIFVDNDEYLKYLSAYIHNNPNDAESYPYSSYKEYIKPVNNYTCDTRIVLSMFDNDISKYRKFVTKNKDKPFKDPLAGNDD